LEADTISYSDVDENGLYWRLRLYFAAYLNMTEAWDENAE